MMIDSGSLLATSELGDQCYSFGNRQLAFLFRRETGRFVLVGVVHASVSNGASLPQELEELRDLLTNREFYSDSTWTFPSVTLWDLLSVAIELYPSGRYERQRLFEEF
jgi:hypothetical protein